MHLAFGIYKYFPFSGLALDMLRIANECVKRGYQVTLFTRSWQGAKPQGINVVEIKVSGLSNHAKAASFHTHFFEKVKEGDFQLTIGFNKIPGVDFYFCGDYCYQAHSRAKNSFLYRLTSRYRAFAAFEKSIFEQQSDTKILSLSEREKKVFQAFYATPDTRFINLPPMLEKKRWVDNVELLARKEARLSLGIHADQNLVLFVGSGFARKGLDRAIKALAALPENFRAKTILCVVGQDKSLRYQKLAKQLGITEQVRFLGGRKDVPNIMRAGDLFVHPARAELAGGVIIEAIVSGLPVLVTGVCGYAWHVNAAKVGTVLDGEFSQEALNKAFMQMLLSSQKAEWRENGIQYSKNDELYAMSKTAVSAFETELEKSRLSTIAGK